MAIGDEISDEKIQYYINRAGAKISALSLGEIDHHEYITGGKILPLE